MGLGDVTVIGIAAPPFVVIGQSSSSSSSTSSSRERPVKVMNTAWSVGSWPCSSATRRLRPSGVSSATTRPPSRIVIRLAEALRLGQVVRREDDRRRVLGVDLLDERLDVELAPRVEPGGGLVEQQQRRARQQGSRDRDLLLHPPAHLLDGPAEAVLRDAQPAEDRLGLPLRLAGIEAVEAGGEQEVLHRAELLEERRVDARPG